MKTKIWKQTMTAVLAVLLLVGTLPVGAAEVGTQELITNGDFTLTDGVPEGWGIVYGSNVTWDQIVKADAQDATDAYIDLSFANAKAYGVEQSVRSNAGDNWLLTFDYKAQGDVTFVVQGNYGSTQLPDGIKDSAAFPSKQAFSETLSSTTGDDYTHVTILIPTYTTTYEEIDYVADKVNIYFRNTAKKDAVSEGTLLCIDNISVVTYSDNAMFKNGDFTLGTASWTPKTKNGGTVEFADGLVKIKGTAANAYISQGCNVAPASILPDGFAYTYYKISAKCKVEAPEDYEGTLPTNPTVKIYGQNSSGSEVDLSSGNWRGTVALTDGWYQCTYFSSKIAADLANLSLLIRGVGADLTLYVDDVVVEPWNFRIHDGSNKNIHSLTPGNSITIEAVAANSSASEILVKPFYAFYAEKDGKKQLISLVIPNAAITVGAGAGSGISSMRSGSIEIPVPPEGHTVTMKAMILQEGTLKPLCQSHIMEQAQ